jgi:hypothetical protein
MDYWWGYDLVHQWMMTGEQRGLCATVLGTCSASFICGVRSVWVRAVLHTLCTASQLKLRCAALRCAALTKRGPAAPSSAGRFEWKVPLLGTWMTHQLPGGRPPCDWFGVNYYTRQVQYCWSTTFDPPLHHL